MKWAFRLLRAVVIGFLLGGVVFLAIGHSVKHERIDEVRRRVAPGLKGQLAAAGFALGDPVLVRIFKESNELEMWLKPAKGEAFKLFRIYPIAYYSGKLGPKQAEGDLQAPEGFYRVTKKQLNPRSNFHLAFDIGYPNEFDRALSRTGSAIMVHGNKVSVGCFAMTDPLIEEIYLIVEAALDRGQQAFDVQAFPFRMTEERMAETEKSEWAPFWRSLKEGHDAFEHSHQPITVTVREGRYEFGRTTTPVPEA